MSNKEFQLSGHVSDSIKTKYKWLTEPNACKSCQALHGNIYDKEEVPKKPHPNCRCHVEEISVIDPEISAQYEYKEEIALLRVDAEKLLGDIQFAKKLLKYANIISQNAETENKKRLLLQEADYLEGKINALIKELNSHAGFYDISYIKERHQEVSNLKQKTDYLVVKIKKEVVNDAVKVGEKLAPDAAALWKLSATKFEDGLDYIKQNGYLVSQVSSLKNPKLEKKVTEKLRSQKLNTKAKGIVFRSNSALAKSVTDSTVFKDFVKNNAVELALNDRVPDKSLSFNFKKILSETNNVLAIHNCDIVDIYLDNKNTIHAKIIDTVDYNAAEWWVK